MNDNLIDNLTKLIDSLMDTISKGQDRLEDTQADIYHKLEKLRTELSELQTDSAVDAERIKTLTSKINEIVDALNSQKGLDVQVIARMEARLEVIETWMTEERTRKAEAEKHEERAWKQKLISLLVNIGKLLGAAIGGAGLTKLFTGMFGA